VPLDFFVDSNRPQRKPKAHTIEVVACDASGAVAARRTLRPVLREVAPGPTPRVRDLTALRKGSAVVVTWQTDHAARGVSFLASAVPGTIESYRRVAGRGRTRFRLVLRDIPRAARGVRLYTLVDRTRVAHTNRTTIT
jgi:hypothetical protein